MIQLFEDYHFLFQASKIALLVKNLPANAGDTRDACSSPGSGRSSEVGNGTPLQYSCLENFHGRSSLAGYTAYRELDVTEYSGTSPILSKQKT